MSLRDLRKNLRTAREFTASAETLARAGACDAARASVARARRALKAAGREARTLHLGPTVSLAQASLKHAQRTIARCVRR